MHRRLVPLALLLLMACQPTTTVLPLLDEAESDPSTPAPQLAILDGTREGGNPGFYWLRPISPTAPDVSDELDTSLLPFLTVEICEWDGAACVGDPIRTFTAEDDGSEALRIATDADGSQHYAVSWHAGDDHLDAGTIYRIAVMAGSAELGFADVFPLAKRSDSDGVDQSEFLLLRDGRTLPIKFVVTEGLQGGLSLTGDASSPLVVADWLGGAYLMLGNERDGQVRGISALHPDGRATHMLLTRNLLPDEVITEDGRATFRGWIVTDAEVTTTVSLYDDSGGLIETRRASLVGTNAAFLRSLAGAQPTPTGASMAPSLAGAPLFEDEIGCLRDPTTCTVTSALGAMTNLISATSCSSLLAKPSPTGVVGCVNLWFDAVIDELGDENRFERGVAYVAQQVFLIGACAVGEPSACIKSALASTKAVIAAYEPNQLLLLDGDGQSGTPGDLLDSAFRVVVLDGLGRPEPGANTYWSVTEGSGVLTGAPILEADAQGRASNYLLLGPEKEQRVTVSAGWFKNLEVVFQATAEVSPPSGTFCSTRLDFDGGAAALPQGWSYTQIRGGPGLVNQRLEGAPIDGGGRVTYPRTLTGPTTFSWRGSVNYAYWGQHQAITLFNVDGTNHLNLVVGFAQYNHGSNLFARLTRPGRGWENPLGIALAPISFPSGAIEIDARVTVSDTGLDVRVQDAQGAVLINDQFQLLINLSSYDEVGFTSYATVDNPNWADDLRISCNAGE